MKRISRLENLQESVIREMTRYSMEYDAINLSQGLPDFSPPSQLIDSLKRAINDDYHQYSVTWGLKELRDKISEKMRRFNGLDYNAETDITVTCGTSEAIMSAIFSVVNSGDRVVLIEPVYENYIPAVRFADGIAVPVSTELFTGKIDEEGMKEAFEQNPAAIVVNSPLNPSGKVFSVDEMKFMADLCEDHDVIAITDEIYEYIIYEGKHTSLASIGDMYGRTITTGGFSKTFSVTGWRVGYAAADKELSGQLRKVHDYLTVCAPTPFQKALVDALDMPESYYTDMLKAYRKKRNFLYNSLKNHGFLPIMPEGAYYMLADFSEIYESNNISSVNTEHSEKDFAFAEYLVKNIGVASVPGSSFYTPEHSEIGRNFIRFSFARTMESLFEVDRRFDSLRNDMV